MTDDQRELLPVTQADREAAASLDGEIGYYSEMGQLIRKGHRDRHSHVQAFARHRIAYTPRPDTDHTSRDRVENLERENAALREALEPFVKHWQPWMDGTDVTDDGSYNHPDEREMSSFARVTFGDLRRARAALDAHPSRGQEAG